MDLTLNPTPTVYADLNAVLHELGTTTQTILGDNFCGAYLQGSFAVGDADVYSDVDFVIVTHAGVSESQMAALGSMHARFPTLDVDWAKHLEGSYIPKDVLRRLDLTRAPCLFVDNGSPNLEWSNHDNTAVVRWVLRNHGIVLTGPEPASLVDEVTAGELREEVRRALGERTRDLRAQQEEQGGAWSAWLQPYVVLTYCRILHTLATGRIGSKRAAGIWALRALDSRWTPLIQRALDDRPEPWLRVHRPADLALVAATWNFIDYALRHAETL